MKQNHTANAIGQIVTVWVRACFIWLTGTMLGCLVLVSSLYIYVDRRAAFDPLTPSGLLNWYSVQDHQTKIGLAGMILTMLGFMFAFWTTSATWRKHRELELRIEAAKEINLCFQRIFLEQRSLNAYLVELAAAVAFARANPASPLAALRLASVGTKGEQYARDLRDFDAALVGLNDLRVGYSTIFSNVCRVSGTIERAHNSLLTALTQYTAIAPPMVDALAPNIVVQFLAQCDDNSILRSKIAGAKSHTDASALSGYARGRLLAGVVPPSLPALIVLTAKFSNFVSAIKTIDGE